MTQPAWAYRIPQHQVEQAVLACMVGSAPVSYAMIQATSPYSTETVRLAVASMVERGLLVGVPMSVPFPGDTSGPIGLYFRRATPLELLAAQVVLEREPDKIRGT